MKLPQAVHLIGIGGSGLSAIARVLLERGCQVSGSDRLLNPLIESLRSAGARVMIGHRAENILGAQLIVRSSAVADDNVEVQAAHAAGIPVLKRGEFLDLLLSENQVIAVAGSHGKTTTTAMIAWMLFALGLDPSYIIGGVSTNLGSNAHAGSGRFFVIEADEYDRMFLGIHPSLAVITNIEHDHPDCYPTAEDFYQVFVQFTGQLLPQGRLLVCADDPGGRRLLQQSRTQARQAFSYGIQQPGVGMTSLPVDYQAQNIQLNELGGLTWDAVCTQPDGFELRPAVSLRLPGDHNVRNALAALAVAHQLGLPLVQAAGALSAYQGTGRRFEVRGEIGGIVIIDDYAHHPTQIHATLAATRQRYPEGRLWAVWQPHTYSRTRILIDSFARAFVHADRVIVTDIYASREAPPVDGFSGQTVVEAMQHPEKHFIPSLEAASRFLLENLTRGDVLLVFSAGDADQISRCVLEALQDMEESHA